MNAKRGFASDNNSGIHQKIIKAIEDANKGHCIAYGDDPFTQSAFKKFEEHFGTDIDIFFVFNGTASNVLGLRAVSSSFHSIVCSEISHLNLDECGAPENFSGCKLVTLPTDNGKITPEEIKPLLNVFGDEHHSQPKAISITQATELGTVYRPTEIKDLSEFAHQYGMYLHMDGARISNAAAGLNVSLRAITRDVGVDVLSFGGAKNGMMLGEAVIFFDKRLSDNFKFIRKQGMQLASKMRFISAQFEAFLSEDLWLLNATHANEMARLLASELEKIPGCTITQKVEANGVFVIIPEKYLEEIKNEYFFYIWDEKLPIVRLMTSYDTEKEDIINFVNTVKKAIKIG